MSVDKRPNGTYRVRWREYNGGPQRTRTFERKRDADAFDRDMQHALQHGAYVDPAAGNVALVQMMREHAQRQPWRYNTQRNAEWALTHAKAFFDDMPVGQVRTHHLQAFVTSLDLEPNSVRTIWRPVRQTVRAAHLDGIIGRDPCPRVKLPRVTNDELVVPTVEEVAELFTTADDDFAVAVVLGAGLGLRAAEACGLTADRVNFLRREVRVDRQWHGVLDRLEPVKYAASARTIPASAAVLDRLAVHIEQHGTGEHGVLLHDERRPMKGNRFGYRWKRLTTATGSEATFHELRHHFASTLLTAGCSIVAAQRALGHATASVTLNTYGHLMPSDADRVRSAIEDAWRAEDSVRTDEVRQGL